MITFDDLSIQRKLQLLLLVMIVGFMFIAGIGFYHLHNMKRNVDELYFGNLVPSTELNQIMNTYDNNIELSIYKYLSHNTIPDEAASNIEEGLKAIHILWNNYSSHDQSEEELLYTEYIGDRIENINIQFLKILELFYDAKDLSVISIPKLQENISTLDASLKKLIDYEVKVAKANHQELMVSYNSTLMQIIVVLVIIVIVASILATLIFGSIQAQKNIQDKNEIELKKLNKQLEESSYTDSLTSLYNRRYFNLIYEREYKRAIRLRHNIVFMMLDIDFFKQYNDTYGHLAGDDTLKAVAEVLQQTLKRPTDFVFRLGGEEFGVILTETNDTEARAVASNINHSIEGIQIPHEKNQASAFVTISIGVVMSTPQNNDDSELMISQADDKLYQAKEQGRNRYVL